MKIDIFGIEDVCLKVYNPETKKVIATYDTYKQASQNLGMLGKTIKYAAQTKTRRYCERLGMEIAIRFAPIKRV